MTMRIKDGVVRDRMIRFRVSAEEEAVLNKAVSVTRFSREQYLRFLIQMKTPKLKPPADFGRVIHELSRINLSLRELIKEVKATGSTDVSRYEADINRVGELIHSLIEEVTA